MKLVCLSYQRVTIVFVHRFSSVESVFCRMLVEMGRIYGWQHLFAFLYNYNDEWGGIHVFFVISHIFHAFQRCG